MSEEFLLETREKSGVNVSGIVSKEIQLEARERYGLEFPLSVSKFYIVVIPRDVWINVEGNGIFISIQKMIYVKIKRTYKLYFSKNDRVRTKMVRLVFS